MGSRVDGTGCVKHALRILLTFSTYLRKQTHNPYEDSNFLKIKRTLNLHFRGECKCSHAHIASISRILYDIGIQ